jgi:hypothetical protein
LAGAVAWGDDRKHGDGFLQKDTKKTKKNSTEDNEANEETMKRAAKQTGCVQF